MLRRVLITVAILVLLSAVAPLLEPLAESPSEAFATVVEAAVVAGLMLWLRIRPAWRAREPVEAGAWRSFALAIPASAPLAAAVVGILHVAQLPDVIEAMQPVRSYAFLDWLLLLTAGPLLEELFLRQVIYDSLRRRGITPFRAAILSGMAGAAFQLAGLTQGRPYAVSVLLQALAAAIQGPLFASVRERTRSVLPAVALHAVYDAVYLGLTYGLTVGAAVSAAAASRG